MKNQDNKYKFAMACYHYCKNVEDDIKLHKYIKEFSSVAAFYCINVNDDKEIRQSITKQDVQYYCENIKSRPWITQFAHWTGQELIEMGTIINGSAEEDKIEQYRFDNMFTIDEGVG